MTKNAQGLEGEKIRPVSIHIRRASARDLPQLIALDETVTGLAKPQYWEDVFERYGARRLNERFFLVAEAFNQTEEKSIAGYVIGEIRAWEFGSEPCGWVFAFAVQPSARLQGVGTRLLETLSDRFQEAGVKTMRTMVARDNPLHMTFFRSEGMMAGPYIQLEKKLDDN